MEAGVNVCIGHDSVMDPWYPLGYGDPLQAAFVLAHLGHMSGDAELRQLLEMITVNPAAALGVDDYGLRVGGPADLVVFDAPDGRRRPAAGGAATPGAAGRPGGRPQRAADDHRRLAGHRGGRHLPADVSRQVSQCDVISSDDRSLGDALEV